MSNRRLRWPNLCAIVLSLSFTTAHADVVTQTLNRAIANSLYCQLVGCTMTGPILAPNGTSTAPSYSFASLLGAGMYTGGTNLDLATGVNGLRVMGQTPAPVAAPTVALAGAGAGNVTNGTHVVAYQYITAGGVTGIGPASTAVNVTDNTTNGQIAASVIAVGNQFTTGRDVCMSKSGTTTPLYLVAASPVIANNTATTYTINVADAGLTVACGTTNTAIDTRATINNAGQVIIGGGTLTANALYIGADTSFYRSAPGALVYSSSGIGKMTFGAGALTFNAVPYNLNVDANQIQFGTGGTSDTYLFRNAAANLQWGVNSATPIAYQHNLAPSSRSGTDTDVAGANATIQPGNGTGAGGSGSLLLRAAPAGATGTAADTMMTRMTVAPTNTSVAIGTGTATATIGGTYAKFVSGTGVGNGADTTDDALWTLTAIPANSFTANGDALVLTLTYGTGATANNKRFGVTVGGTQINTGGVTWNTVDSVMAATITRVDATHVNVAMSGAAAGSTAGTATSAGKNIIVADLTANTLAIVVTGASYTTGAANDVKLYSGIAEFKK